MLRRRPLSLPYEDEVPILARLATDRLETETVPALPERFVRAALHHGFALEVLTAVREGSIVLPAAEQRTLSDVASVGLLRCAALRRELAALTEALGDPVLVKGPALADRYYADPRARLFADLDLMVARESLAQAPARLAPLGYEVQEEFRPGFGARHGHDLHLVRKIGTRRLDVEVHWRIGDDRLGEALDHRELLASADRADIGGAEVAVPSTPHQLLVVALHLLSDRAKRLVWVRDVELLAAAADDEQWDQAFAIADRLGLLWVLHRALDYAATYLRFQRARPRAAGAAPPWGPLRAVEELDMRASTHVGRLAALPWRDRPAYLGAVLVPTADGLRGTVGADGAPTWRLAVRHASGALAGLAPRRR